MKRILLLTTLAAMMAAAMALSGVAQAAPITNGKADAQCLAEAVRTLPSGFKPSDYAFHGGTEGGDRFTGAAEQPEVFCGFGGEDSINPLDVGDIFLGGAGNDFVDFNYGTFYGGAGNDQVIRDNDGTVYGGADNDTVSYNRGTFYGEAGDDVVGNANYGIFHGGAGNDRVEFNDGTFVQD